MAYDQHTADVEQELEQTQALLGASERMRDSLRLERDGLELTRRKDNEYLLGKIDEIKACLRDLMDAADRDRQGAPLPYEEWRIRYDEARRLVGSSTLHERTPNG